MLLTEKLKNKNYSMLLFTKMGALSEKLRFSGK